MYIIIAIVVSVVVVVAIVIADIHIQSHPFVCIYAEPRARKTKWNFLKRQPLSFQRSFHVFPMELWSRKQTHTPTTAVHPQPANRKKFNSFFCFFFFVFEPFVRMKSIYNSKLLSSIRLCMGRSRASRVYLCTVAATPNTLVNEPRIVSCVDLHILWCYYTSTHNAQRTHTGSAAHA